MSPRLASIPCLLALACTADAATGTFMFTAKSPGSSTLKVTELFRGAPQLELEYAITLVDP